MTGSSRNLIKDLLVVLPNLVDLDIEYYGSSAVNHAAGPPLASLRSLKVTTSAVDAGPQEIWPWILQLVPKASLESLTVQAFSAQSRTEMPYEFLARLSSIHGQTFRKLDADKVILSAAVLQHACTHLPRLEFLSCSLPWCQNIVRTSYYYRGTNVHAWGTCIGRH